MRLAPFSRGGFLTLRTRVCELRTSWPVCLTHGPHPPPQAAIEDAIASGESVDSDYSQRATAQRMAALRSSELREVTLLYWCAGDQRTEEHQPVCARSLCVLAL